MIIRSLHSSVRHLPEIRSRGGSVVKIGKHYPSYRFRRSYRTGPHRQVNF